MRKASFPLILTNKQAEVRLPERFLSEPETGWRMVEMVGGGFFVAVITSDSFQDREPRTLIASWDSDLLGFVESPQMAAKFLRLHHFAATAEAGTTLLRHREVVEIRRGVDTAANDAEVIVFLASDGTSFCGQEAIEPPPSVRIDALVAAVGLQRSGIESRAEQSPGGAS